MTLVSSSSIRLPADMQEFSSSVEYRNNRFILKSTVCIIAWERWLLFFTNCNYIGCRLVVTNQKI